MSQASSARASSRRTVLTALAGLLGATGAGSALLGVGSRPAVAVDGDPAAFEAGDDPTVVSNDGRIEAVYLAPELVVSWADFGSGVRQIDLTLAVGSDAGVDEVYALTLHAEESGDDGTPAASDANGGDDLSDLALAEGGFDAVDGRATVEIARADATARGEAVTSDRLSDGSLAAGESTATTLDLVLRADVYGREGEEETVVETTTVEVAVENPDGDADAGGEVAVDAA